ncbi:hypothetical protein ABVF61_13895 [Roseibium sp. HPY-6]|uniref:hypothetical protein n=1 Tax=Roseibium sp. HPY-6 TaxID=3229852 RepID=UPI00338D6D05
MPVPYSLSNLRVSDCEKQLVWNDPRRELYPYHQELWPEEVPEHVLYEREALELRRQKQITLLHAFVRFRWVPVLLAFLLRPRLPRSILEDPMKPGRNTRSDKCRR